MINILSLNGGGIRGLILAKQLQRSYLKTKFDVITGTSTGAIIASLLALKYTPTQICVFYIKHGLEIFKPTLLGKLMFWRYKYSDEGLNKLLKEYLGENTMLSDIKHVRLLIMATNKENDTLKVFDSTKDLNVKLWEVVRASSSAPRYFKAFELNGVYYIDGGMKANNPSFITFATIRKETEEPIKLLSITTGRKTHAMKESSNNDGVQVVGSVIDSTLDGIDKSADFACESIVRPCDVYFRCESFVVESDGSVDNASESNINAMIMDGIYSYKKNAPKFRAFDLSVG